MENKEELKIPMPEGCRWCGTPYKEHGQRYIKSKKIHVWEAPTQAQITARIRARMKGRGYEAKS